MAPATDYRIYMTARNQVGASPASASIVCRTDGIPPPPPVGTCAVEQYDDQIVIYWQDGISTVPGFDNNAYSISYEPTGNFLESER